MAGTTLIALLFRGDAVPEPPVVSLVKLADAPQSVS